MKIEVDRLDLKGKKAGIYGIGGATGKTVVGFLSKLGNQLLLYDDEDIDSSVYEVGWKANEKSKLLEADFIVASPGVSLQQEFFKEVKRKNIMVISEIELAYNFFNRYIIAITGTNGKTTTASLTGKILSEGLEKSRVKIAGNIGTPLLDTMINSEKDDIIVAEVSSFQLAGIKKFAPDISVVLNFAPDHLDWHRTLENYKKSKQKIFLNQTSDQIALINADDYDVKQMANNTTAVVKKVSSKNKKAEVFIDENIFINGKKVIKRNSLDLREIHNLKNVAFAAFIGNNLGVAIEDLEMAVNNFSPPSHRMQIIKNYKDLVFIDDSKASNPHAACSALKNLDRKKNIVIIAGGQDRNLDLSHFAHKIQEITSGTVLMGEIAESLKSSLASYDYYNTKIVKNMEQAVYAGVKMLSEEGVLILSPGAPSWDMYESYKKRGECFRKAVEVISEETL